MIEECILAVAATGRAAFSSANASRVRAELQKQLADEKRSTNLKNADDQCVAGLLALRDAMSRWHCPPEQAREWGILVAPRAPGRPIITTTIQRYATEGAWGVSPHIVPNSSLHSIAGFLSVAYDFRGPNLGVGGAASRESDVWMVAPAWLADGRVPGVWIVMTGWSESNCMAVALALPNKSESACSDFRLSPARGRDFALAPKFSLESLDRILALGDGVPLRSRWSVPGGFTLEWRNHLAGKGRLAA